MKVCLKCNIEHSSNRRWCKQCYIIEYGEDYKALTYPFKPESIPESIKPKLKPKLDNNRKLYWDKVKELTEHNKHNIKDINKRNFYTYHIDHKISIKHGFENSIPPQLIAHPTNLHILEREQNIIKNTRNIIDEDNRWIWDGC